MSIQQRRLGKGWTQEELALHSGLSARTIQRVESGKSVGAESLKCLAAVFETSITGLIQEQKMDTTKNSETLGSVKLNTFEKEAIRFAKSIFQTPKKEQADPLTKIERKAIDYGKSLLKKFKQS
ncbi:helix-turn-helix transcriptional regulator [Psychrosphaera sp. 1_MG-2023]|uniref:helix-turn-helix domain-containing protein n=1 Tax=Psychrosphaera sp. 1_MG-2023 TaxID=3062643 RepID=UPI0026E1BBA6|nr:helix-turn-helix transcriptional regulator [Psychrosphaera sp. 1_MG-2023]MDO6719169.1 helix-turn-helix transcriptional regulator [Psychrosphaera sp. 1_MG-2023]